MMSKTHIAVGTASALAIASSGSIESCIAAVIGGSIGGIIADCDITPSRAHKDALIGRLIVVGLTVLALAIDSQTQLGICNYVIEHLGIQLVAGILLFATLTFVGAHTDHRTFTHSLLALTLFCAAVYLICEPLLPYFAIGYASHLVLDLTNRQSIWLFYPLKTGVSTHWFHAKGFANKVICVAGTIVAALLLLYRLAPLFG